MRKVMYSILLYFFFLPCLQAQNEQASLEIKHLRGDFYVYTTYQSYRNMRVPSNGLYLITKKGAVIIDSPWDTTQCQPLLEAIEKRHQKKVVLCIATHFHADRTGAFPIFRRQGIKTFASQKTDSLSKARGEQRPEFTFAQDTTFQVGEYKFQTYFAGEGHSTDNIVVWFPKDKVLHGGCLIKSTEAEDLGYTGDANVKAWRGTIENLLKKYPKTNAVITGHQKWDKRKALHHTLKLLEK
ncbi:MAG: BlaB/IND/MUS family subclass B1 metallo-beta-lactamase [Bacteroidetes bacterium]|nr:MAG: BlaB/IND/MUS family subclass B1 metallo-beta-lactamase [Bacteroidota bacterium]